MIKKELVDRLLSSREKYVKKSFSLKKTLITFPFDTKTQSSVKQTSKKQNKKQNVSPTLQSSQIMKKKAQRQRYVKKFDELITNPQKFLSNQFGRNSEVVMKRSNSMKAPTSKIFDRYLTSQEEEFHKRTISNADKIRNQENAFGEFIQNYDTRKSSTINSSRVKERAQTQKQQRYDLDQYSSNKNARQLLTCTSLRKSTQIQFCNQQIAALLSKKKVQQPTKQEDSCDETSFKVVLQKIKSKDLAQISRCSIQQQKLKYIEKVKIDKLYTSPKQINYNFLIQNPTFGKNMRSVEQKERINFQAALQWSNKQTYLMKKKSLTNSPKKEGNIKSNRNPIIFSKKSYEIDGWQR